LPHAEQSTLPIPTAISSKLFCHRGDGAWGFEHPGRDRRRGKRSACGMG
jgi:hypothetical protein